MDKTFELVICIDKLGYKKVELAKGTIDEIDKSISHLQKIKDELLTSQNQLRLANDKAQDLSIKKLTRNNPTMKERFNQLKEKNGND